MMSDATAIKIQGATHKFDPNDEIFDLAMTNYEPLHKKESNKTDCYACEQPYRSRKLHKDSVTCEFCAMDVCYDCATRKRQFPESIELENGDYLYGKICKVCDRKFLMLEYYNEKIKPVYCGEANLRHLVQKYEMKVKEANQAIKEQVKFEDILASTRNDNRLKQMRVD